MISLFSVHMSLFLAVTFVPCLEKQKGVVVNNFELNGTSFPLIWRGDAANISAGGISLSSRDCLPGDMDSRKVKGRLFFVNFFGTV